MRFSDYLYDNRTVLLVCFSGGLFFSILLFSFGLGISELILLWICFIILTFSTLLSRYLHRRKRIRYLLSVTDSLEQKYLIAQITDKPEDKLEQVYFRLLKAALKSMTDEVARSQRQYHEYRDFIERWIHEIKVPITGILLLCENNKTDVTRNIRLQTEIVEQEVEKVLYYARIGNVEKDYFIKKVSLKECVREVLARNKQFLIQTYASVHTEAVSHTVYTDNNWICFILNQIIFNSIKYRSDRPLVIQMESQDRDGLVTLAITDNGMGIKKSELNRIFDKGFVGSNGRAGRNATGMGLYLCDQLCPRLGTDIGIESEEGRYTTVILRFPKSDHFNLSYNSVR